MMPLSSTNALMPGASRVKVAQSVPVLAAIFTPSEGAASSSLISLLLELTLPWL
jgi:hypothetical protein